MDHIFDFSGIDASAGTKLTVPQKDYSIFPSAASHRGGWHFDTGLDIMYWADGTVWHPIGTNVGTVTSVDASATGALQFTGGPITDFGVLALGWTSTNAYLVQGDGSVILKSSIDPSGKFVALSDADAAYSNNIASTDPNTIMKSQFSYSGGHSNMFLGAGGHLFTNSVTSDYGAQIAVETSGSKIGFRTNFIGSWTSWANLATESWVSANFTTSKWTISGADIYPTSTGLNVSSNPTGAVGYVQLAPGNTTYSGYLDIYSPAGARQGFIGFYTGEVGYTSSTGAHHFRGGNLQIDTVNLDNTNTNLLTWDGSGNVEYRTVASLPFTNNAGTVTQVTSGNFSPLFNVSVATNTTIPDISFTVIQQNPHLVYAAPWGVFGTPLWRQLQIDDLQGGSATTGQVITWNGSIWTPQTPASVPTYTSGTGISIAGTVISSTIPNLTGKFVALNDTDAAYNNNIGSTNPNTITKTQTSYSTGHGNMFLSSGGHLFTNSVSNQYGAQIAVETTGTKIGFRTNYIGTWSSWANLATESWVSTNFTQYWEYTGSAIRTIFGYSGAPISTYNGSGYGYIQLISGGTSQAGYLRIYSHLNVDQGFIGYHEGEMAYTASVGNHHFRVGAVKIDTIASSSSSVNILTTNAGVIETRTIASLGIPASIFNIQGGSSPSTSISDNIWHNGNLWLGNGSGGSSSFRLSVSGSAYITGNVALNNNASYTGYNFAGSTTLTLAKIDTSNKYYYADGYMIIETSGDAVFSAYGSGRTLDSTTVNPTNIAYYATTGKLLKSRGDLFRDDGGAVYINTTESNHVADSIPRRVTFDTFDTVSNSYITYDTSSGTDNKMRFGSTDMRYAFNILIEYTTSGTPTVKMDARKSGTATIFRSTTITSADARKQVLLIGTCNGDTTDYLSIFLTISGSAISLLKAEALMWPIGLMPA